MSGQPRTYPLRKPENHKPPVPRWKLVLDDDLHQIHTAYIGVQQHESKNPASQARAEASDAIRAWLGQNDQPAATEDFSLIAGNDASDAHVWVCYWVDEESFRKCMDRLGLRSIHAGLSLPGRTSVGLWCESFTTSTSRLETNYSGLDYLPGLARLPGANTTEHSTTAYWGAARDRIPDSAHDLFEKDASLAGSHMPVRGLGQRLVGKNHNNIVHIRSGQFWSTCNAEEAAAYEEKLEPTLEAGLSYLWENPVESGAIGLRYLRNGSKETCVAGFFNNLSSLEDWAKTHPSHLAIYRGALSHAKKFGRERKFRTWHEVSVLKKGEVDFEYVNCLPETGVMKFVNLDADGEIDL